MKKNLPGFTLIELLVVIAIIGLLATLAVVSFGNARLKARDARRYSDVKQIMTAMQLYKDATGSFPNPATLGCPASASLGFYCLGHGDAGTCWGSGQHGCTVLDNALKPYLPKIPDDPENNTANAGDAYLYSFDGTGWIPGTVLTWGMNQATNPTTCFGGQYYGQWSTDHYWCATTLQ
ncbi:MAG: type II secretion system GspH family protein [Candidatus Uhrbacteria bacterium]|nr:type II secretion system GspH family protein [Candidatus Uhrbacteria bacterium]